MRVQSMPTVPSYQLRPAAADRSNNPVTPTEIKDGVTFTPSSGGSEGSKNAAAIVGGIGGIAIGVPAGVLGAAGGAVAGSLVGTLIGVPGALLLTDGIGGFFGGVAKSANAAIQIGSAIGGLSGLYGGYKIGANLAQGTMRLFGADVGERNPDDLKELTGISKIYAQGVAVTGFAATASGGALAGAILTAGVGAAQNIATSGFSWESIVSNLGANAALGAAVGGVAAGVVGAYGATALAEDTARVGGKVVKFAKGLFDKTQDNESLEEKEARLNELQTSLEGRTGTEIERADDNREFHQQQTASLDSREMDLIRRENDADERESAIDGNIGDAGRQDYERRFESETVANGQTLKQWTETLDTFTAELDQFERTHRAREVALDREIEERGQAGYAELKPALEQQYRDLQQQLNEFEQRLDRQEREIDQEIERKFQADFQPKRRQLETEISRAQDQERRAQNDRSDAQRDYNVAAAELGSAQSELRSAENSRDRAAGDVRNLRNGISSMQRDIQNLRTRVSKMQSVVRDLESQLRNCR